MKFIRDIIAEKTSQSEQEMADPGIMDQEADLSGEVDPVDMVASGGLSLGGEGRRAFLAEEGEMNGAERFEGNQGSLVDTDGKGGDDAFDLLADDPETGGLPEPGAAPDSSELFADIWAEESDEDGSGFAADHDDGIFSDDMRDADDGAAATDEIVFNDAPAPGTESKAEALMRTMYQSKANMPDEDSENQDTLSQMSSETSAGAPEDQANRPGNSAFQAILKRQQSQPAEPEPTAVDMPQVEPRTQPVEPINVPAPAAGRGRRQAGRVKTRLLGFGSDSGGETDLFAKSNAARPTAQTMFPVGWIVVVSGPGLGNSLPLFNGVSQIGRGEDQALRVDFGDNSISRANHAAIAYDPEQKGFFLGHGGKANLVRLNDRPVLSTEPLENGSLIRIGETTLRFVALCGQDFDWDTAREGEGNNARFG